MIASTYRLSTRAVSLMGFTSPDLRFRGTQVAGPHRPAPCMPSSNDTLVLVDAFSKIMARVFPRSGLYSPRAAAYSS